MHNEAIRPAHTHMRHSFEFAQFLFNILSLYYALLSFLVVYKVDEITASVSIHAKILNSSNDTTLYVKYKQTYFCIR